MTTGSARKLHDYAESVVDDFLSELDSDCERWPDKAAVDVLVKEVAEVLDGRASDWWICKEKREELPL